MSSANLPSFVLPHIERIAQQEGFQDYVLVESAGSNQGDGFMSDMVRITLSGQRIVNGETFADSLPLICKLLPANIARQQEFSSALIFEREVIFYTQILPLLQQLQTDHGIDSDHSFNGYPYCYSAASDPTTMKYVLIMKDLRSRGFTMCAKNERIEFDNVKVLMEQLGRMHGLSFVLRDQRPVEFCKIQALDDIFFKMLKSKTFYGLFDMSFTHAVAKLQASDDIAAMKAIQSKWFDTLYETMREEVAEPFAVLTHGDCWNNNVMFSRQNGDCEICLLDWQASIIASPALDISCFLMSSTDKALRDQHYEEFIRIYYDNLATIMQNCGSDPQRLFTFDDLLDQLRRFGRYGVIRAPILLQIILSDPNDISDMDALADKSKSGESDVHDIAIFNEKTILEFRQRLGDVIGDAKRLGWI